KLRDADGAIIRNNRFIVQSGSFGDQKAEAAINLLESKNVLIENNTAGHPPNAAQDETSTAVERGNQLK
ncbi:MAG: right-handed parallel beta-helix repeat-containing protein, partial [Burkholderiales bacterium]|nr:right-handed parallel beta-helix repeat-containing protein [Burkholderiales bacterium]